MTDTVTLLEELTTLSGPPGYESAVARYVQEALGDLAEVSRDNLGSILCCKRGTAETPRLMLAGHMDEIGFMVKLVTKEGFVKFSPLGGWWDQVLLAQRVRILTGRGPVTGTIGSKPPHLLTDDKRREVVTLKDMFIDVGAKDKEHATEELGIRPGDAIVPDSSFVRLGDGQMLLAKAWDDRAGVAMFVQTLQRLAGREHPNTVYGVGTVQEEVGLRGAQTSVELARPDVALVTETAIAGDTPGIEEHESAIKLGGGPGIYVMEGSMIPNLRLRDLAISVCREKDIPYQLCILERGGTDGGRIHVHAGGVPSLVIGVPTRHIHSHAGIMHLGDYEQCVDLLVELCLRLDGDAVRSLSAD